MKHYFLLLVFVASSLAIPSTCFAQIVPAPTDKQAQSIELALAPIRKKVGDILEADKTGQNKVFRADMDALIKEKDPARHQELASAMDRNHKAFVQAAFKVAKIDLAQLKKQVAGILGHNKFTMDEFGGISLSSSIALGPLPTPVFSTSFNCPLGAITEEENAGGIAYDCKPEVDNCGIEVNAGTSFIGSCRTKGSLGGKYDLSGGTFTKTTVSAQSNAYYFGCAYGIASYGQFNVKIGVRLKGPGINKTTIVHENWCIAPVLWFSTIHFDQDDFLAQAVFSGTFASGDTFTAQAYAETYGLSIGLISGGGGFCYLHEFDFVRVTASN